MFKILLNYGRVVCVLLCCICSSMVVSAQNRVTGKVTGADDKQPVVGASVRIKGTTIGTVTNVNGNFTINASPGNVLVISYIGYQPTEVTVTAQRNYNITLSAASTSLNEIVVTGYTAQRRKDITGSVASVDVGTATKLPVSSTDQVLQGQVAGVTAVTSGAPGATAQITIRGISNFGNSSPLIIIDGVQGGDLSNLNPDDIESMNVLKDAGSTAIYGVSGGNGVIVITTKKGKGKSTITYDGYYGTSQPKGGNVWNVLNASEYQQLLQKVDPSNALLVNGQLQDYGFQNGSSSVKGVGPASDPRANPALYKLDANNPANDYLIQKFNNGAGTDWFHELFKPAPMQMHTVTASGSNEKNNYLFSMGYLDQQGTLIQSYYKRMQVRVNTNFNVKNHIRVGESGQVYFSDSPNGQGGLPNGGNQNEGNPISETYRIEPQIPVYDIAGNFGGTFAGPTQLGNASNPVAMQERQKYNHNKNWHIEGNAYAEADFLKHFTLRTSIGGVVNNNWYYSIGYRPYDSGEGHANSNSYTEGAGYTTQYNWTNTLTYNQSFDKHNISFVGGYEAKSFGGHYSGATVVNLFSLDPNFVSVSNGSVNSPPYSGQLLSQNNTVSLFARLDYNFNNTYYISGTIRRDGSSLFYTGRQYGTFPAVSVAYRITQEKFMKNITWLNDLKIRGSYGTNGFYGNVNGANAYLLFGQDPGGSYYPITGSISSITQGFFNSQIGNQKTTWETDKNGNIGFDASLINKLDVSLDYFKKDISGLLFRVTLPATVGGASAPYVNVGSVSNKGLDGSVRYHDHIGSDFNFSVTGTLTSYHSNIDQLSAGGTGATYLDVSGSRIGNIVRDQVGHPIGSFYGYKVIGYFSSAQDVANSPKQADAAPGRFKYADINGDGKISDADRTFLGNPNPKFTYGLNLTANYKGWDFTAVLYGSQGNQDFNYIKYWTDFYSSLTGNKSRDLLYNSWSPSNLNPKTPIAEASSTFSSSGVVNSFYVESGSFLKLKLLEIGYTLKPSLLKHIGVDRVRVYAAGSNLFTITKYTGLDPELQSVTSNGYGVDYGNYPSNERRYTFGANLSF